MLRQYPKTMTLCCAVLVANVSAQMPLPGPVPVDLERFADLVQAEVDGNCTGWQFAIYHEGVLQLNRRGGYARTTVDEATRLMSTEDRQDIASCSKFPTAMALCAVLAGEGISPSASAYDYFPESWQVHEGYQGVTFAHFLSHTSGLKKANATEPAPPGPGAWSTSLRHLLEQAPTGVGGFDYENINFAAVRVLLAHIVSPEVVIPWESDPAVHEAACAEILEATTREYVFIPAGLGPLVFPYEWHPNGSDHDYLRYYDFAKPELLGHLPDQYYAGIGPGHWELTAWQLAHLVAAWENGLILDGAQVKSMKGEEWGVFQSDNWAGGDEYGPAYRHNGELIAKGGSQGGRSLFISFPGDVQFAMTINSRNNAFGAGGTFVLNAFYDATRHPDLVITEFQLDAAPYYKGTNVNIPVRFVVLNQGTGACPVDFFNGVVHGSKYRWSGQMTALSAGESAVSQGVVVIPDSGKRLQGRKVNLVAQADALLVGGDTSIPSWSRIKELDETNNDAWLTVLAPN